MHCLPGSPPVSQERSRFLYGVCLLTITFPVKTTRGRCTHFTVNRELTASPSMVLRTVAATLSHSEPFSSACLVYKPGACPGSHSW